MCECLIRTVRHEVALANARVMLEQVTAPLSIIGLPGHDEIIMWSVGSFNLKILLVLLLSLV